LSLTVRTPFCLIITASLLAAADTGNPQVSAPMTPSHATTDASADLDPSSTFWKNAPVTVIERDNFGKPVANHRSEVRSRWTDKYLYFLFTSPYVTLSLKPNPVTNAETNQLWDWDVAEVFIGSDFHKITRYKEFEVSPQGEWVDLDISRDKSDPAPGIKWDSGFQSAARIDAPTKTWYAFMRIPWSAIDSRPAAPGNRLRINLYRIQGPPPDRIQLCWRPTGKQTFHVPESFGILELK
jgi:hypothetical protein